MKKLKWVLIGLVAAVVVVVAVVIINIDRIVHRAVETQSTASLGLDTTLGGASVSLLGGSVQLSDYAVGSPGGFSAPSLISVGGLGLDASLGDLRQDPVRVSAITVSRPKLYLEQKDLKLNLKAALDQMPKPAPSSGGGSKEPVKLVIGTVKVESPTVVIRPGIPGVSQDITLELPTLTVNDIGTGPDAQNGVAIKEVVLKVATAMAQQAADSDKLPPEVRVLLKGDLSGIQAALGQKVQEQLGKVQERVNEQVGKVTEKLGDQTKDAAGKAQDEAKKALDKGLGNLLGGEKKK